MKITTSCSWAVTLSLMSILSAVVGATPAHSQSATAPGAVESHPGGSQKTLIPAKPRSSQSDGALRNSRPSDLPIQTPVPNERARILEERLRSGQMERPIAQGDVSDRLEQLHNGSAERSTGETAHGESVQGEETGLSR
jgi:hypothetical protein